MKMKTSKLGKHVVSTRERIEVLNKRDAELPKRYRELFTQMISDLAATVEELRRSEADLSIARRALEVRVQERTAELRRQADLLDLAREAIIVWSVDGSIRFWNQGAERLYGWTKKEAERRVPHELLRRKTPVALEKIVDRLRSEGHWEGELIHFKKNDERVDVLSHWHLRKREDGAGDEVMEVSIDITDRKRFEERLRQSQKMEALGTLVGGIAHDFNNILGTIVINSELALRNAREGRFSPKPLELALDAAGRGKELVKQVIAFSRQKEQARRPIELARALRESVHFLRGILPKNIEIVENIEPAIACALADETQVQQILTNLASNSAHAMRHHGGTLTVSLVLENLDARAAADVPGLNPGPHFRITVDDTGEGINPRFLPRIFDPFFTTKKSEEGAGMGLAVVQGIVRSCGGAIQARSEPGKGSTFEIFIPRHTETMEKRIREKPRPSEFPTGSERILLVEDDRTQIQTLQNMLEFLGYAVTARTDGRDALEDFKNSPDAFDLMITDQTMPGLAGAKLAAAALQIRADLPVILCTGYSEIVDENDARAMGIREFIMKPFSIRDMAHALRRALKPV